MTHTTSTAAAVPVVKPDEMRAWSAFVHKVSGIFLDPSKTYLIQTRLADLYRTTGAGDWSDLLRRVQMDPTGRYRNQVVNAITTNETSFFRDRTPFDLLRHKLIPDLIDRRRREGYKRVPIRIFSAACSTGQEVYSTIIMLDELLGDLLKYDLQIAGTDISDQAVAQASSGVYSPLETGRGLTPAQVNRYFQTVNGGFKVRDNYRFMASFRKANLLDPYAVSGSYDIVFCRNVGIYFREEERRILFRLMASLLKPDGALIIGSTESLTGFCPNLEAKRHLRSVYYQRKTGTSATHSPASGKILISSTR
ncbi:MAG: chemotaxis protein methyltransferase CheR [Bacteroidetes bacterium HLUCCA01]|nr:MAG: chemotaxis protein methyltransferase CheR [Bacteroidetes bacterium HLUCCA01]